MMQCVFNPKDTNTFASASLDRTVKVGGPGLRVRGHSLYANCIEIDVGPPVAMPFVVGRAAHSPALHVHWVKVLPCSTMG